MFLEYFINCYPFTLGAEQDLANGDCMSSSMISEEIEQSSPLPPDWIEERFRVDRRKLEDMILGMKRLIYFISENK